MTITLVFQSNQGGESLGSLVIPSASSGAPIPSVGDNVTWTAGGNVFSGLVKSRLLSYTAPQLSVGRDDEVDLVATLAIAVA